MAILVNSQTVIFDDRTVKVSSGATRPASPVTGMFWYNTSLAQLEVWNGTAWKAQNFSGGGGTDPQNAYAWGAGYSGQLGTNTRPVSQLSPLLVVGGFTDWAQISTSNAHTAAVRANGTAWAWGSGLFGKLGDGTTNNRSSPVSVVGGFTDWVQIATGLDHTVAVRANGTAWAWGRNQYGQQGSGFTTGSSRSSPVSVAGGFTDWVQIAAGENHTAAVRANGTAWAWGHGAYGRLGDNSFTNKSSPVSVVGGFTNWVQISSGRRHTIALRTNGTAWAWGSNSNGQLGDGTNVSRNSPVAVIGGFTDWVQIVGGDFHTAAVRANGTAWAWGLNVRGQLGDGTIVTKSSPVAVVGGFTDWVQISAGGDFHTAAIRANGTAWAWGSNSNGRLGDGTIISKSSPVSVVGGFTDWVQISASGTFTSAAIRG